MNIFYRKIKESFLFRFLIKNNYLSLSLYKSTTLYFAKEVKMKLFSKGDVISDSIAFLNYYEWDLSKEISEKAKNCKIMVDAGANMGYFSLLFLANSNNGIVYAFEPNDMINIILEENIFNNGFTKQASIIKKALSSKNEYLNFSNGNDSLQSGWGHIDASSNHKVEAVTIDDSLNSNVTIDILKIDVEGFEMEVLKGAKTFLKNKKIKNIYFELNEGLLENNKISGIELIEYLENYGYSIKKIDTYTVCAFIK